MKKKLFAAVMVGLIVSTMICGCSSKKEKKSTNEKKDEVVLVLNTEKEKAQLANPLTGEALEEEIEAARPLIVSIDNVGSAIPQSWLSKADLVYEFPVEGKQTRLQAVFYSEFPEEFGPIRSTRPYFVDLTREYKGIFLAHGWSQEAKQYLMSGVVPYINAMNSDCNFYRVSDKSAPHNSYIKWSEVKNKIESEGWWKEKQEIRSFTFLEEDEKSEGEAVEHIEFESASPCEFTYESSEDLYVRTIKNGQQYIDKETGEPIKVKNVLVQKVSSRVLDAKGRLKIDMCTGGDAILFTNGKCVKGTWTRESLDDRTIFKDNSGNEFKLSVGTTWVMIADQNTGIDYKTATSESGNN